MTDRDDNNRAFGEYRLLIMDSLREIKEELRQIKKQLSQLEVEIVALKIKAGLWGALAGAVPGAVAAVVMWLRTT